MKGLEMTVKFDIFFYLFVLAILLVFLIYDLVSALFISFVRGSRLKDYLYNKKENGRNILFRVLFRLLGEF